MTKSEAKFLPLLKWRQETAFPKGSTVGDLADSLSCERLRDKDIPARLRAAVTAFRHLRQSARQAAVRAFFGRPDSMWKKPRKRLRKVEPEPQHLIAVCGYLSQKCSTMKEAREWLDDRLLRCTYPRGFIVDGRVTVVEKNFQGLKRTVLK